MSKDLEQPNEAAEPSSSESAPVWRYYAALACIWGVVLALFWPALGYPFTSMDDPRFILYNQQIVDPGNASIGELFLQPDIGYIVPVTGLIQALLYAISDGSAWSFHLLGLLGHGVVSTLFFAICLRLLRLRTEPLTADAASSHGGSGAGVPGQRLILAVLATLVFAAHPIVVEPVAWATGSKDILMAVFALLAIWLFLQDAERIMEGKPSSRRLRNLTLVAMILALLSKPTGALVPLALGAFLFAFRARGQKTEKAAERPFSAWWSIVVLAFAISAIVTAMSWFMHSELNVQDDEGVAEGSWQALLALGHQLRHLFWPDHLFPRYPIDRAAGFGDPLTWVGLAGTLCFAACAWFARRKPLVALGLAFALFTYLPVSSIIPFPRMVGDSYAYMPLAGLLLAGAAAIGPWLQSAARPRRLAAAVLVALLLIPLSVRTADQVRRWESPVDLWYPGTQEYDDWVYAWMQIADGLRFVGDHERALHTWEQLYAREYTPDFVHKVALLLVEMERLPEAECVMVEDQYFGDKRSRALHNHALMLVNHPGYQSSYPRYALQAMLWALDAAQKDALQWPSELVERIPERAQALHQRVGDQPPAEWTIRGCNVFRAEKEAGRP